VTRPLSLFLDLIRFSAALLVFLHHCSFRQFGTHLSKHFAGTATEPVIAFFVLSGFVIAYTAEAKDRSLRDYWVSRLARLLSVSLPAIALTVLFDYVGRALDPGLYAELPVDSAWLTNFATSEWLRVATTATFTNEIWWLNLWPGTNGPFWSLGYEVAYYLIFSIAFYLRGALRPVLLAVSVLAIGPKIMLLFPVWLLGVFGWRIVRTKYISTAGGALMIVLSLVTYILFLWTRMPSALGEWFLGVVGSARFSFAAYWPGDIVTGFLFTACIIGFTGVQGWFAGPLKRWATPIRLLASMTFSLYLLHYPLMYLLAAVWRSAGLAFASSIIVLGGTLAVVFLISRVTEVRKDAWRTAIGWLLTNSKRLPA
jgi:peptidoglycan/LPS O-acetylase OafA/YrhL